ncbi:probable RNA-directed DNA polymerase from transposon X-element [Trichonephila clavipes]|nr:probable RNA-directed DNA polymerase from transposon X-element [Trichonephila clavipes]
MTSFISWNCRGLRTRLDDLKSIISTYQPACVALQETFLKRTMTMRVRGYNCVRRDVDGDTSPNGGVCLFTSHLYPSHIVTLHTSLQAVAVRIHIHSLVTVCCVYLPPNDVVPQVDLNQFFSQLPAPFILLGDFNGHSPLWGHDDTNSRGRQIEQLISDHCLCLLNNDEKTYFHAPTRTFHSLDLAICSPTLLPMLNFEVANDLHNSDHFPLLVSHVNGTGVRNCPPIYRFHRADWDTFTRLAVITGLMFQDGSINDAVLNVTEAIRNAADATIPKTSNFSRKLCKPWWNSACQQAKKEQRRRWGIFRRYPTTDNLIAFKRAKALARKIRRQSQRESWIQYVSSITSSTTSQQLWRKVKTANGLYRDFSIPILETSTAIYSSPVDVANVIGQTFASVSSSDSYSPAFQATKNRLERTNINFRCRQPLPYNCDFDMCELKRALSLAHNTSPGPDGISYELLRHLNEDSLISLLYLFNRIWREQVYPTQWQEAIVIPILKPGKDPKNPLSYRPIALTSCLCKTLERMVNARFVFQLEKHRCIPLFQSGRSTLDNIIMLENKVRNAFVRRNHLVSIFFDIEKAYDRTWRYGILRTLFNFGLRGNLPIFIQNFLNVRTFKVRLGDTLSASFLQAEGVPQGSILSVTLFICHISSILNILSPSIQSSFYVDDLQISCEDSDMRIIERQLQTAVNNIVKWCCQTPLGGADRTSLLRVYQAIVLSRIDYGCVVYGSACNSTLKKLDPVHHRALRICSGAFRTSPVQSLYVNCHQLPLDLRRRKLSLAYYFKILSVPSHPLQNVYMSTSMKRLYDSRPSNIRPFMDRMKLHISEFDLPNVHIQQRNLFLFQPWNTPRFHYINPFASYSKSTVAPVVFQRVFAYHRSQYSSYSTIYTDGSKRADYVGCGVVIEDVMHGYRLHTSCSIFTAEAVVIYRALQLIDSNMPRKYCIYTDSMSVL